MIFKQETVKSWFTSVSTSINNEVIQPFRNAEQVIWKYNQAVQNNSLTQQGWSRLLAQSDDSLKAYLTSIKGTTASITGYNALLQGNFTGFNKVSSAINQYNTLSTVGAKEQNTFATAVSTTNGKLGTYLTGLNGAKASLSGYGISLIASTAKTIGLTVATTALNTALSMGISVIISGMVSAFTSWINKAEEITEKAQEAADKISSINDNLKSNIDTVENAKKRYAGLAQEVENLGKIAQSQGTLNNEEYEEFLNLSNQLACMFPQLRKCYDNNGNAILNLSGSVDTIVGSLDNLIQKEKEFANQKIMEEFPDVFSGWTQDLSKAEQGVKNAQTEFDKINNTYQQLSKCSAVQAFDLRGNGEFENENGEKVKVTLAEYEHALKDLGITYEKTNIMVKNQFGGDTLSGYLIEATGDIDTAFTSKLEKARENLKYAQQQFDAEKSSINQYLNTWLQTEFSYSQIKDSGLQSAIQNMLFNFDWSSLPDNIEKNDWEAVSEYLRRNILFAINNVQDNEQISTALSEIFENTELTPDKKTNYLQQIQDYFGEDNIITISLKPQIDDTETLQAQYQHAIDSTKEKFDGYDPSEFFKEHSINTQEEIDAWQKIAQGARDAAEAEKKYIQSSTVNDENPISTLTPSDTINQLNTQLKPAMDSLKSAWQDIFTDDGFALDSIDIISTCDSIKSKLDELNEIKGITVDYSAYEHFIDVLNNSDSTVDNVKESFNNLASSITQAGLSGAEDFETMKAALEDLGVVNEDLVAFDALISNTEALKEAGLDLANATDEQIAKFANEMVSAENLTQAIDMLTFTKLASNAANMDTSTEVANLRTLAENAGYTGDVIQYLTELEDIYQGLTSGTIPSSDIPGKLERAKELTALIQESASNIKYEPEIDYSSATRSAARAGKEAGKSYSDALKDELSNLNDVVGAIGDIINNQIDLYEDQKDAAVDALEAQKEAAEEALEAEKALVQEQINAKQAEIDKIKEAAEARKNDIDLQQKQYELARLQNQRTIQ